jgi:hypothetical protein
VSAGWVAGSVRASAMARRRLGTAGVRALAASPGFADALDLLAGSPYAPAVHNGQSLAEAEHAVAETVLWNLRVLAGWLPPEGAETMRLLAGWFEIANVDEHLAGIAGRPAQPRFRLGMLATAWPRLAGAGSRAEVRATLASSPWGDPGDETPRTIQLALRVSWARRVAARIPDAQAWATGAVALLAAREMFVAGHRLPQRVAAAVETVLGTGWSGAGSLRDLSDRLPSGSRWALRAVREPADLWRAEALWWARLHRDGRTLLAKPGFGGHRALGAAALLGADAWRVRAGLELAARRGDRREVLDVVA